MWEKLALRIVRLVFGANFTVAKVAEVTYPEEEAAARHKALHDDRQKTIKGFDDAFSLLNLGLTVDTLKQQVAAKINTGQDAVAEYDRQIAELTIQRNAANAQVNSHKGILIALEGNRLD